MIYTSMHDKVKLVLAECEAGMSPDGALSLVKWMIQMASNYHDKEQLAFLRILREQLKAYSIGQDEFEQKMKQFEQQFFGATNGSV